MKIAVIYGTQRKSKSSTYNIAQQFIQQLSEGCEVTEFFLPQSMPNFCRGCWQCFTDYTKCPDYKYLKPMTEAMDEADLLIFTAPVYVYHVPGQLKAFLDHFGYRWMPHQPNKKMFHKQVLLISTAAGAGTKSTLKDLKDSMMFWGVARVHTFGRNVRAANWDTVSEENRIKFQKDIKKISEKIKTEASDVKPSLKVKGLFYVMRYMQKKFHFNEADVNYWKEQGWFGKERPWH
jgi:Multimeric flavodoxin WrbA